MDVFPQDGALPPLPTQVHNPFKPPPRCFVGGQLECALLWAVLQRPSFSKLKNPLTCFQIPMCFSSNGRVGVEKSDQDLIKLASVQKVAQRCPFLCQG